ncbi:hypothetical protein Forpi1262_v009459 [Fusarium oxysporum f. sp. raphani]|uniref:CHAT domain-containing protein n=1 Tax=Fusarium oxysporum f. sp. raphani TaxID=96318 RepID=A0A8J5PVL6_FUSOX|nr:hypothetical protein Forpi1262_v009459 [Fusarium oxysporum f. sp. raphani]
METELRLFKIDEELASLLSTMDDEDLSDFATLHKDPQNDEDVETFIYIGLYAFMKLKSLEHLQNAHQCSQKWVSHINDNDADYMRRQEAFRGIQLDRVKAGISLATQIKQSYSTLRLSNQQMPKDLELLFNIFTSLSVNVAPILKDKLSLLDLITPLAIRLDRRLTSHLAGVSPGSSEQSNLIASATDELEDHIQFLQAIANGYCSESEKTDNVELLNSAVGFMQIARNMLPDGRVPLTVKVLMNLGSTLGIRSSRTGSMTDLNDAIDLITQSLELATLSEPGSRSISASWNNLADVLAERFRQTGSREDLDRAVQASSIAAEYDQDEEYARFLDNLGKRLIQRFQLLRSMEDLERGVDALKKSSDATPKHVVEKAARLGNYSSALAHLFDRTKDLEHLRHSIKVAEEAIEAVPTGHYLYGPSWASLASRVGDLFEQTQAPEDLHRALEASTRALDFFRKDDPSRPAHLVVYAGLLKLLYERTGLDQDHKKCIEAYNEAIEATPPNHPDRAVRLGRLADFLRDGKDARELLHNRDASQDIDTLVETMASMHMNFQKAVACDIEGFSCENAMPVNRIVLARHATLTLNFYPDEWGLRLFENHWEKSYELLEKALTLVPKVSPRTLAHLDKQHIIEVIGTIGPEAASVALKAGKSPYEAVRLLELGRGVIAGSLLEIRGDISILNQAYPDLAARFVSLRDQLDSAFTESASKMNESTPVDTAVAFRDQAFEADLSSKLNMNQARESWLGLAEEAAPPWELKAKARCQAEEEFDQLLATIRSKDGFEDFLHFPSQEKLKAAAEKGPIVIVNISTYCCDAFLIESSQIKVLPLSVFGLTLASVEEQVQQLSAARLSSSRQAFYRCLKWLWDTIAKPCLDALGLDKPHSNISGKNYPRLWWIPTGPLCHLPLHAAGDYQSFGETVLDRVMPSYAPSAKSLVFNRQHRATVPAASRGEQSTETHALLIAMAETRGFESLSFAAKEVDMLRALLPALQFKTMMPSSRKAEVLRDLKSCSLFHFAGHGRVDLQEPSLSCLLLDDWEESPLTVGDLRDSKFQDNPPFLAFLSACSTGVNPADKLDNEGIHLISAFQLAGFRHVVGTLWEVVDEHCVDVARVFYETMRDEGMTDDIVCQALHRAVRLLRDRLTLFGTTRRGFSHYEEEIDNYIDEDEGTSSGNLMEEGLRNERDPIPRKKKRELDISWASYIHYGI